MAQSPPRPRQLPHIPLDPHRRELLGLELTVTAHSDPGLVGRRGRVLQETRETLVLGGPASVFRVAKRPGAFEIITPEGRTVTLRGARLAFRSRDRVKKGG